MGKIIGIDLGTTKSIVAVMEGKEPKIIVNEEGARLTPSVVAWDDKGEILTGQSAKRQAVMNPMNTVCSAKRFIGRRYEEAREEATRVPYKVKMGNNNDAVFEIRGKEMTPPEVSARVLMKLKKAAEDYLGEKVTEAVITVPAYFNDSQRQATKDAGRIAGLEVKRIVSDSTATALVYGLDKVNEEVIAVYDFGGGTFDISILEVGDNVVQVISTNGDTHLGGDDVDHLITDWLVSEFRKDTGIDVSKNKMVIQRLKDAAEQAKIELSNVRETTINLQFLTVEASGPKHLQKQLTRLQFEQMIKPLVDRTMEPVRRALADARKNPQQIDQVVLVGGSTRIPIVEETVKKFFGKGPHKGVNPDEVVAVGAAIQAGVLAGDVKELVLLDVTPLSLGIETLGGVMMVMIPRNTTIPTQKKDVFSTATDSQPSVEVHVLQGERTEARYNRTIGRFHLEGIMPAPRGIPKIEVTFDIDANGILSVHAKDTATGKNQRITITASGGLKEGEIQRMANEAAAHGAEDEKRREEIQRRNMLDNLCYTLEKTLNENRDKVPEGDFATLTSLIAKGRSAVEKQNDASITAALEELEKEARRVANALYEKAGSVAAHPGAGDGGDSDPPADPEFEDDAAVTAALEKLAKQALQRSKIQLKASTLRQAALDCMAALDSDPKNVEAREAAAQAHIRLVVIGAAKNRERKLLDRAIELDPYSAQPFLLAALTRHREGALSDALVYYDHACWVSHLDPEVRYHRGYALLEATRTLNLSEEEAAALAEEAAADFEAVLERKPDHAAAALGAIEAAIQGKVTKLRDTLKGLFARVAPHEARLRAITVLLYQAIFAFRVGKAKNVDQKNQKTMADIGEIARMWIAAFPHDADLAGVLPASQAKCESAEGLCERIAEYARGIPDVRILRLLMRERLAEVPDARRRLELFESAMKRIPALDGIAHDYLQLRHLAAKRAAAEGDLSGAQTLWLECEQTDPDNPSVVMNLLHLASNRGDKAEIARLTTKLEDLWALYARVSPRPDLVLMRAHARHEAHVLSELDRFEQSILAETPPRVREVEGLVDRWIVGQALARLAVDGDARDQITPAAMRAVLSFGEPSEETLSVARQVVDMAMKERLPTAYAYLGLAKDVPDADIPRGIEAFRERLEKTVDAFAAEGGDPAPFRALVARAKEQTRPLLDPVTRAAYDRATAPVDRAEICRRQSETWRRLVHMSVMVSEMDVASRTRVAEKLAAVPRSMMEPYLETAMQDARWFEVMLLRIRYLGVIKKGWELFHNREIRHPLAILGRDLAGAADMFAAHELLVLLIMRDTSVPLWESVEGTRRSARRALELKHWTDGPDGIPTMREFAEASDISIAQRVAADRALTLPESNTRAAAEVLWAAYPGKRSVAFPRFLHGAVVKPLSDLAPNGRAFYAFAVARVLRSDCIDWYNAQQPDSHDAVVHMKSHAGGITSSAHRWAMYAMSNLRQESLRPALLHNIFESLTGLMEAIERDARAIE